MGGFFFSKINKVHHGWSIFEDLIFWTFYNCIKIMLKFSFPFWNFISMFVVQKIWIIILAKISLFCYFLNIFWMEPKKKIMRQLILASKYRPLIFRVSKQIKYLTLILTWYLFSIQTKNKNLINIWNKFTVKRRF